MTPKSGRKAIEENRDDILQVLDGADMVFITAGMGGGTGTGASAVLAELAQEVGALSVAVVTKPFTFEGRMRSMMAEKGINELKERVDTLITIPNDRLLHVVDKKTPLIDAFRVADNVLDMAFRGFPISLRLPVLLTSTLQISRRS